MDDGAHRWIAVIAYELTPEDAAKMGRGTPGYEGRGPEQVTADDPPLPDDPRPWLGLHNISADPPPTVACYTCEQPWTPEVAAGPCPGEPPGELAYVDDGGREVPGTRSTREAPASARVGVSGVGRNDPCPCGSGVKFKRCHGR